MTATADSPSNIPANTLGFSGDDTPLLRHRGPWSQIVRGDQDFVPANPSSPPEHDPDGSPSKPASETGSLTVVVGKPSDEAGDGSSSVKKQAWNKPSNEPGSPAEVGPVMGAASWPALFESARVPSRSGDSPKPFGDGSRGSPDVVGPQSQEKPSQNSNADPAQNHVFSHRQKSMNRRNANIANGDTSYWAAESPHSDYDRPEWIQKDYPQKNNWESGSRGVVSQGFSGNNHPRNSFRRGNGSYQRADNLHNNNHGNKGNAADRDRGNYQRNSSRGGGRDFYQQRNFIRQPANAPFMNLSQACATPIPYPEFAPQVYYVPTSPTEPLRGMPFIAHAQVPALFFPAPDPQLSALLVKQIEYYFSGGNLCKDIYLRQNMDKQGWVPISVIANFNRFLVGWNFKIYRPQVFISSYQNRIDAACTACLIRTGGNLQVRQLTNNIPFILDSMRMSSVVEIQGDKIRKRGDWNNWLLPPQSSASNADSAVISNVDDLTAPMRGIGLEGSSQKTSPGGFPFLDHHKTLSISSSEEFAGESFASRREAKGQTISPLSIISTVQ